MAQPRQEAHLFLGAVTDLTQQPGRVSLGFPFNTVFLSGWREGRGTACRCSHWVPAQLQSNWGGKHTPFCFVGRIWFYLQGGDGRITFL